MNSKTKSWFLLILLAIIWGSSFILMKKSMFDENGNELLTANEVASLRIFISGIIMISVFIKQIKIAFGEKFIYFILVGLLGNLIPAFLFTNAEKYLTSSETGILNSLVPIFSVLVASYVFRHKISKKAIGGVIIGLIGTILLIAFSSDDISKIQIGPSLLVVAATICYAFSLNIIKNKLDTINSFAITGVSLVFMIIPCFIYLAFYSNITTKIIDPTYSTAFGLTAVLAVVGTTIALIVFNQLIKMTTSIFASSVTYLIPVVAILWGVYFKEPISWGICFAALIIVGVVIVKKEEQKRVLLEKNEIIK
ncbi:DMT family transporter [Flavobacteriales bacterium]|nr:DMT family transporter [Flavobacteriales bacterium]